jgi:uncharacterized Zn finger protein
MAWKKVVMVVAVSACPVCGNGGFDLESGADIDDPHALVRCGKCGHVCTADQFSKSVAGSKPATTDFKPGQ